MSNPQSELFKELSSNEIFAKYLSQLNELDEATVLTNALNDNELMQKLVSIINDLEIIKTKMQIKINQANKGKNKITSNPTLNYPYEENNILYLTDTIKIVKKGLEYKIVTPEYVMNY